MLVYLALSWPTSLDGLYLTNANGDFRLRHVAVSIDTQCDDEMTEASTISNSCTIPHTSLHMDPSSPRSLPDPITSYDQLLLLTDHGDDDLVQELPRTTSTHAYGFVKRACVLHHKGQV